MKLAQRTALVTGAGNGIGRAITTALGREGARILIADLHHDEGSAALLVAAGIEAHGMTMDAACAPRRWPRVWSRASCANSRRAIMRSGL